MFSSSTSLLGSEEEISVFCIPCDHDGLRLPASGYCTNCKEHLCGTCFKFHKRHTLSRHHTLLDKNNMPQTQQVSVTSVQASQPDDLTKPCPKHRKEMIKFYCHNHNTLLCSVHFNSSKKSDRLFMELKFAEKMINDYEKSIQPVATHDVKVYTFKPSKAISKLLEAENSLGTLTYKTLAQPSPPPDVSIKSRQTSHQGEIQVKTSKDKGVCRITGMTLLTPDLLIITDSNNRAIKMVDTCSQSVTDHLQLDTVPCDVTSVTSTELAATLLSKNMLQFLSVSSNKLAKKHTLNVNEKCYGISCCQGKLVVSFLNPSKIKVFDNNGTMRTTIHIFSYPEYVTASQSGIYVSDSQMRIVTRLNWQGRVTGIYDGLDCPVGITPSNTGTVFACDHDKNVIEEISSDCSKGNVVLKGLKNLRAVCWCDERSLLYFSYNNENDDYLKIYNLS